MKDIPIPLNAEKSPFLQAVRTLIRSQGKAYKTEQTYILWIKRFIYFIGKRHPNDVGETEVAAYLSHLAVERRVSINTQKTALNAIVYMYRHVLNRKLENIAFINAKVPRQLPVVFPRAGRELAWQYLFPAAKTAKDPRTDKWRRHHVMDNSVQRRVREAV